MSDDVLQIPPHGEKPGAELALVPSAPSLPNGPKKPFKLPKDGFWTRRWFAPFRVIGLLVKWLCVGLFKVALPTIISLWLGTERRNLARVEAGKGNAKRADDMLKGQTRLTWIKLIGALALLALGWNQLSERLPDERLVPWALFGPIVLSLVVWSTYEGWRWCGRKKLLNYGYSSAGRSDPSLDQVTRVFWGAKLLLKPKDDTDTEGKTLRAVRPMRPEDNGHSITIATPVEAALGFDEIQAKHAKIAAGFEVHVDQLQISKAGPENQVTIFIAKDNPFLGKVYEHPLLNHHVPYSVFDGAPIGVDQRGRVVMLPVVGTHFLFGGKPNSGKTSGQRAVIFSVALDPHAKLYIFDGKGGADWEPFADCCEEFYADTMELDEQVKALDELLKRMVVEMRNRYALMKTFRREGRVKHAKITRELHESGEMPFIHIAVDEFQIHIEHKTYGNAILENMLLLGNQSRAAGIQLDLATQKPSSKLGERFTDLRDAIGTRAAFRTIGHDQSNMILGNLSPLGYNAANLSSKQQGLCWLRPDSGEDTDRRFEPAFDAPAYKVLTFFTDDDDAVLIADRGVKFRSELPQEAILVREELEGPRALDELLPAATLLSRFRKLAPEVIPETVTDANRLGEWLKSKGVPSKRLGDGTRVRSRLSVEVAVGLSEGRLRVVEPDSADEPPPTPDNPLDTPSDEPPTAFPDNVIPYRPRKH